MLDLPRTPFYRWSGRTRPRWRCRVRISRRCHTSCLRFWRYRTGNWKIIRISPELCGLQHLPGARNWSKPHILNTAGYKLLSSHLIMPDLSLWIVNWNLVSKSLSSGIKKLDWYWDYYRQFASHNGAVRVIFVIFQHQWPGQVLPSSVNRAPELREWKVVGLMKWSLAVKIK